MNNSLSIIIPARNEAAGLTGILPEIRGSFPDAEILVVDDGSDDETAKTAAEHGARVVSHPYPMGNGAAIKTGARRASGDVYVFMDGDGQHRPDDIGRLLEKLGEGFDMVVGARDASSQASAGRLAANMVYNKFASWVVGNRIQDLTSGFRAVTATRFKEFLYLLPNGFSYPSTITMAFFRSAYPVAYIPIKAEKRTGKSHIKPLRDGVRFLLIMFRIGSLYSPLKLFFPVSLMIFCLGLGYYAYTYFMMGRFTNMTTLLFVSSIFIFLIGLVSEQVTMLIYKKTES